MSIEALAMAGQDYLESGINFDEYSQRQIDQTPDYLLVADDEWTDEGDHHRSSMNNEKGGGQKGDTQLLAWTKEVVASSMHFCVNTSPVAKVREQKHTKKTSAKVQEIYVVRQYVVYA
ncbi:hypothetical protein Sjap_018768 [Stephania japonica]|uniref:Uncharacterized protein n=1 Tax=Stephania japonica TaxID=461633 RepID=A0AAP0NKX1_9MAGN